MYLPTFPEFVSTFLTAINVRWMFIIWYKYNWSELGPKPIWNATHTDKLRRDLLLNYDKFARPAQHYNTTTVKFGLTIRHIEINEFKSTLTIFSWIRLVRI